MVISVDSIIAYILGGLTFIPTVLIIVLLHAYFTFPVSDSFPEPLNPQTDSLQKAGDDGRNLLPRKSIEHLAKKFERSHEPDVAAGYFAVCREYVPGGVNGKPPERTTPAGAVVAAESPSVYQSMYRSLFDRRMPLTLDAGKTNGRVVRRARNVFFVVLRHGHLMLYEDSEQLEVKHVISLEHHDVDIYGGGDTIAENELWIKRNAIRLTRKGPVEQGPSKPFFLFSENSSEKEDFYFALLLNQEIKAGAHENPPRPQHFNPKHIIGLVQRLHSSEEQLQTRWFNGLVGRLFLALYQTAEIEELVRQKVTKKIARVQKPSFLSDIVLQKIDMGDSGPQVTNPKLKDFTIDGDCCVEADISYSGNFRLEIAATARLDLGARFKAREMNLILAVVVKKLHGHGFLKVKPTPSNRVWLTFEKMPDMELSIEPIVSSRQITYSIIHRAIENRIREVVAETIVLPHWDDSPFTDTTRQKFRGGIWAHSERQSTPPTAHVKIPDEAPENEAALVVDAAGILPSLRTKEGTALSIPKLSDAASPTTTLEPSPRCPQILSEVSNGAMSSNPSMSEKPPKFLRSSSFASIADPLLSHASADSIKGKKLKNDKQRNDAATAIMAISSRSPPTSPSDTSAEQGPIKASESHSNTISSIGSSADSNTSESTHLSLSSATISDTHKQTPTPSDTASLDSQSPKSITASDTTKAASAQTPPRSEIPAAKRQSVAAIGAATMGAKIWGWSPLARSADQKQPRSFSDRNRAGTPKHPIGRGHPLPPLGEPLPFPVDQRPKTVPALTSKRKALPPSLLFQHQLQEGNVPSSPVPPLPARRKQPSPSVEEINSDGLLVVQAPDPEPPSPSSNSDIYAAEMPALGGAESISGRSNENAGREEGSDALPPTDVEIAKKLQTTYEGDEVSYNELSVGTGGAAKV